MQYIDEPCGPSSKVFRHESTRSILAEKDMGVVNGHIAVGTPYGSPFAVEGLYAIPYVSTDFKFNIRLFGEKVKTERYVWYPNQIFREGRINDCAVASSLFLMKDRRAAILRIVLKNLTELPVTAPLQASLSGGIHYQHDWGFAKPYGSPGGDLFHDERRVGWHIHDKYVIVGTSAEGLRWFEAANLWEGKTELPPGQAKVLYFSFAIGREAEAYEATELAEKEPAACEAEAEQDLEARAKNLLSALPSFTSDNQEFEDYYYRSLVHYLTNEWNVDELVVNPYYSTGGINGGCLSSYLYDFSAGWKLHPLYRPEAFKEQMKVYLKLDLTRCYAFLPVNGNPNGPWYPVNQEKIIGLVYYHVLITGDKEFLKETVNGRTVLQAMIDNAMMGITPGKPISLIDYGLDGEHHLELGKGSYHGILPDLNARRYMNFIRTAALCRVAGNTEDAEMLLKYAADLKTLVRQCLWDDKAKWFRFISQGVEDMRYTVQMFKLCDSEVLDPDMLDGLLSHLNEEEFLSDYGLHSMSKLDGAYDQIDIDNGGGGCCTIFANVIPERLYEKRKTREADDILSRVLWWGQRVPFWGDSMVANAVEYRQDTPLQSAIGGVTGAQCIIFGVMGVEPQFDGSINIHPHLPEFAGTAKLNGLKILGRTIDISCGREGFTVVCDGRETTGVYGETLTIKA